MAFIVKIKKLSNGVTYNYPIMEFSCDSEIGFKKNNGVQYSDLVPLYSFLELGGETTDTLEINGKQFGITIDTHGTYDTHYIKLNYNNTYVEIEEPNVNQARTNNSYALSGTVWCYNYKLKKFCFFNGCASFTAKSNTKNDFDFIPDYYAQLYEHGNFQEDSRQLVVNNLYQGIVFGDNISALSGGYYTAIFSYSNTITNFFKFIGLTDAPTYPNTPDNSNEPDAPTTGDGDTSSDAIPEPPPMPTWDINNTGFVTMYNPTVQQIRDLAYFMWSGEFVDLIKKMFSAPFDSLISLKMLFADVPSGTSQTVWLGNVETTVSMSKLSKQFIDMDMGTITINEFFGSFADYAPFTKIQIFLPFIGYKDLNVDEVMNSQIHLRYRIDAYSGACIAFITVTKNIKSTQLNAILYQFDGNCAMELPFTQNDNSRYVAAILNSAASSALSLANSSTFTPPTIAQGYTKSESAKLELGSLAPVANGMLDVLSTKPNVQRAGSLAGAVASMGVKQPYIVIHRPIAQMPSDYQHYLGIPLNLTRQLSTVSGYTIISQVFMTSATATDEEITMITELLKSGVIF